MKPYLYLALLICLLSPAPLLGATPPDNQFMKYVPPDLQAQYRSEWQVDAVAERDSMGYLVVATDPRYQKFWLVMKSQKKSQAYELRGLPPVEGYQDFERQEIAERDQHNAPSAPTQNASPAFTPPDFVKGAIGFVIIGIGIVLIIAFYFLPSIIAILRRIPQVLPTIIINLVFGWTLVGWVVALCFACWTYKKERAQ